MSWCFGARTSAATRLSVHPCLSICVRVKPYSVYCYDTGPRECIFLSALGGLVAWCLGHQATGSHRAEQVPLCFQLFSGWIILSILLWNWSNEMTILSALGVLMAPCMGTRTSAATELSLYPEVTSWLVRSNHAECDSPTIKLIFLSAMGWWCNNRTYTFQCLFKLNSDSSSDNLFVW